MHTIQIGNRSHHLESDHFSLILCPEIRPDELLLLGTFSNLRSASFSGSALNDEGLAALSNVSRIEILDLQDTQITNEGLKHLQKLKNLTHLRLKGNCQLTNDCIQHLSKIEKLEDLQLHETAVDIDGIILLETISTLKFLVLDDDAFDVDKLTQLSKKLPACDILVKGKASFMNGTVS